MSSLVPAIRRDDRSTWTRVRGFAAVVGVLMLLTTTGCSEDSPPGESAPALAASLDEVDAAVEAGEFGAARKAVEDLISETAQARVEGDISDEEADRIFEAARDVLAQLPKSDESGPDDGRGD